MFHQPVRFVLDHQVCLRSDLSSHPGDFEGEYLKLVYRGAALGGRDPEGGYRCYNVDVEE